MEQINQAETVYMLSGILHCNLFSSANLHLYLILINSSISVIIIQNNQSNHIVLSFVYSVDLRLIFCDKTFSYLFQAIMQNKAKKQSSVADSQPSTPSKKKADEALGQKSSRGHHHKADKVGKDCKELADNMLWINLS